MKPVSRDMFHWPKTLDEALVTPTPKDASCISGRITTSKGDMLTGVPILLTQGETVIEGKSYRLGGLYCFGYYVLWGLSGTFELSVEVEGYEKWSTMVTLPAEIWEVIELRPH